MKKIIIFCFIFFANLIHSQELKIHKLLPPESKEYKDLHFLNDELQGKHLVMLGEMTHMYGNIFEMKIRIIEYLHKELGYSTIAMESSMYDLWLLRKKSFNPKDFNSAIWGVWSSSQEFQRLVNYIEKNHLKVIGFDSQFNNNIPKFIDDFFHFCNNKDIELKLDEDDLAIVMEGVLENISFDEDDIKFSSYERELNRIIKIISGFDRTEQNYYWLQFIKNLLACSKDAYYNKEFIPTTDFASSQDNIRDMQMADNLLTYMDRNPNEKIICWADNIHIINDISSVKKPVIKDFISMGTHIKHKLKNKVYSLATIHANDSLLEKTTWHPTPVLKGSFEDKLKSLKTPYLFVSSNQKAMRKPQQSRLLNFVDFSEMRLDQLHDGYIFIENAKTPKNQVESIKELNRNKEPRLMNKIKLISRGKSLILKGQIIDSETKVPIPYANIIMRNEEIYRIADENGKFELPIMQKMLEQTSVNISSMGYESRFILLKNLKSKIKLVPKYEQLDEVVITGYSSPKTILSKAIKLIKDNNPITPFNFKRYGSIIINKNDETILDLELITKDYDQGYLSPFIITQRVEQIKWNKNASKNKYKYSSQFFGYRQNAIRYANILHKRKYKKFTLNFVKSNNPIDENLYIIEFETDRNKWNYTNRTYPTKYSGKVYIDKESLAIIKVIENWETTLNKTEIEKYFKGVKEYKDKIEVKIKEENSCTYSKIINQKHYASNYFHRASMETLNTKNKIENSVFEAKSQLYDFKIKNVEQIEYEYRTKKETVLNRIDYDADFWNSFYKSLKNVDR